MDIYSKREGQDVEQNDGVSPDYVENSYVDTIIQKSLEVTLSGTPGVITEVSLPDTVKGIKLYSAGGDFIFAIDESPEALATSSSQTIPETAFSIGGFGLIEQLEVRLLPRVINRKLYLRSTVAGLVIKIEIFL